MSAGEDRAPHLRVWRALKAIVGRLAVAVGGGVPRPLTTDG